MRFRDRLFYKGYTIVIEKERNEPDKVHWVQGFTEHPAKDVASAKFQIDLDNSK